MPARCFCDRDRFFKLPACLSGLNARQDGVAYAVARMKSDVIVLASNGFEALCYSTCVTPGWYVHFMMKGVNESLAGKDIDFDGVR